MVEDFNRNEYFSAALDKLDSSTQAAVKISERSIGVMHTGRQKRALIVFIKLITHNMTVILVANKPATAPLGSKLLDHFSVAALGRASIDASLMTMYLSHPTLTLIDWNLRRHVLFLHDLINRRRFLGSMKELTGSTDIGFFNTYKEVRDDLRTKIGHYGRQLGYGGKALDDLCGGQAVFTTGARGAVREANWDVNAWDFHQSYLSAYVHSHPVSYMRAEDHKLSFHNPSDFQFGICGFIMETIAQYTDLVCARMDDFSLDQNSDPLGQVD